MEHRAEVAGVGGGAADGSGRKDSETDAGDNRQMLHLSFSDQFFLTIWLWRNFCLRRIRVS